MIAKRVLILALASVALVCCCVLVARAHELPDIDEVLKEMGVEGGKAAFLDTASEQQRGLVDSIERVLEEEEAVHFVEQAQLKALGTKMPNGKQKMELQGMAMTHLKNNKLLENYTNQLKATLSNAAPAA